MSLTPTKFQARGLARRESILAAAGELFLEKGFEQTTLSDIVQRSGGSRRTLYEHFGSKEGLLAAIIKERTCRVWQALELPGEDRSPAEEDLLIIGTSFFRAVVEPQSIALFRIMVAEGARIPAMAELFLDSGPRKLRGRLKELFALGQAEGKFRGGAPEDLAQAFLGLIVADFHLRQALGQPADLDDAAVERHVRSAVEIFLRGVCGHP